MPKVEYTTTKVLFQSSGSGVTLPRKFPVLNMTATAYSATAAESGTLFVFDGSACTVTLPQAAVGLQYSFVCGATQSGDAVITTQSADGLAGVLLSSTVALNSTNLAVGTSVIDSWAATIDTLTLNGTTQGGVIGTRIDVVAVSSSMWVVSGIKVHSGNAVTSAS